MNANGYVEGSIGLSQAVVGPRIQFGAEGAGDPVRNGVPGSDGDAAMSRHFGGGGSRGSIAVPEERVLWLPIHHVARHSAVEPYGAGEAQGQLVRVILVRGSDREQVVDQGGGDPDALIIKAVDGSVENVGRSVVGFFTRGDEDQDEKQGKVDFLLHKE
jgi:hypothetical protein